MTGDTPNGEEMSSEQLEMVTKSEAARRWGVSPSILARYAAKGMPIEGDGHLDWAKVKAWRAKYIDPARSGSFAARQREAKARQRTASPGERADAVAAVPSGDAVALRRAARLEMFQELTGGAAIARYAGLARRFGLAPEQCYLVSLARHIAPVLIADNDFTDTELAGPEADWPRLLGNLDFDALNRQFDAAVAAEFPELCEETR
jgi:hypothetical protein